MRIGGGGQHGAVGRRNCLNMLIARDLAAANDGNVQRGHNPSFFSSAAVIHLALQSQGYAHTPASGTSWLGNIGRRRSDGAVTRTGVISPASEPAVRPLAMS